MHAYSHADLNVNSFRQLEHLSIGYQSLTDIPKAIKLNEPRLDYKVRNYFF